MDSRALCLTPARAQISTLAHRDDHVGNTATATAVFDSTSGPTGSKGAVTFDRELSQYINSGAHTFYIASNGGLTTVATVKFTGAPGIYKRVIDFGTGQNHDNILLWREGTGTTLSFEMWSGSSNCRVNLASAIIQNIWMTIVATYAANDRRLELRVGSNVEFVTCDFVVADRSVLNTYVGKSNWPSQSYLNGTITDLYAVDVLLSEEEIMEVIGNMYTGNDTLDACQTCPVSSLSQHGSTSLADCVCDTGYTRANGGVCSNVLLA